MNEIQWPLEVLSRAVHYKNLTGASQHIGLSQPQLSRLIAKLEEHLKLNLLDRTSKRSSMWTVEAKRLAEVYVESQRKLHHSISEMQVGSEPTSLHMGTLEGLASMAMIFAKKLFDETSVKSIKLDVLDQDELEALFLATDIDLIFSSRVPGQKKLKFLKEIGGQGFEQFKSNPAFEVMSPFEFGQKRPHKKSTQNVFVSNSLSLRREWLQVFGGEGQIPGAVEKRKKSGQTSVLVLGQDYLSPLIWERV